MSKIKAGSMWALLGSVLCIAAVAYGQDAQPLQAVATSGVTGDPTADAAIALVSKLGLPGVVGFIAYWARGAVGSGIPIAPVTVVLKIEPATLRRIAKLHHDPDSDEDEGPRPKE